MTNLLFTLDQYELVKVAIQDSSTTDLLDDLADATGKEKELILNELRSRGIEAE